MTPNQPAALKEIQGVLDGRILPTVDHVEVLVIRLRNAESWRYVAEPLLGRFDRRVIASKLAGQLDG